jgi:hypothetical protein
VEEFAMSKPLKSKKNKVPKITEEEYMEYLTSLRTMPDGMEMQSVTEKSAHTSVAHKE